MIDAIVSSNGLEANYKRNNRIVKKTIIAASGSRMLGCTHAHGSEVLVLSPFCQHSQYSVSILFENPEALEY